MFTLEWDIGDPNSETKSSFIVKANYNTKKEAVAQAEADVSHGKNVLGVKDKDGKSVWKP